MMRPEGDAPADPERDGMGTNVLAEGPIDYALKLLSVATSLSVDGAGPPEYCNVVASVHAAIVAECNTVCRSTNRGSPMVDPSTAATIAHDRLLRRDAFTVGVTRDRIGCDAAAQWFLLPPQGPRDSGDDDPLFQPRSPIDVAESAHVLCARDSDLYVAWSSLRGGDDDEADTPPGEDDLGYASVPIADARMVLQLVLAGALLLAPGRTSAPDAIPLAWLYPSRANAEGNGWMPSLPHVTMPKRGKPRRRRRRSLRAVVAPPPDASSARYTAVVRELLAIERIVHRGMTFCDDTFGRASGKVCHVGSGGVPEAPLYGQTMGNLLPAEKIVCDHHAITRRPAHAVFLTQAVLAPCPLSSRAMRAVLNGMTVAKRHIASYAAAAPPREGYSVLLGDDGAQYTDDSDECDDADVLSRV